MMMLHPGIAVGEINSDEISGNQDGVELGESSSGIPSPAGKTKIQSQSQSQYKPTAARESRQERVASPEPDVITLSTKYISSTAETVPTILGKSVKSRGRSYDGDSKKIGATEETSEPLRKQQSATKLQPDKDTARRRSGLQPIENIGASQPTSSGETVGDPNGWTTVTRPSRCRKRIVRRGYQPLLTIKE